MKNLYRSIPFEAFELKADMSNWCEAYEFIGELNIPKEKPEFILIPNKSVYSDSIAIGPCFICKVPEDLFEVWTYEKFIKHFEKIN